MKGCYNAALTSFCNSLNNDRTLHTIITANRTLLLTSWIIRPLNIIIRVYMLYRRFYTALKNSVHDLASYDSCGSKNGRVQDDLAVQ
jgi:hypothetical protein